MLLEIFRSLFGYTANFRYFCNYYENVWMLRNNYGIVQS